MTNKKYNADSIQILEGLEAVRKRPSMYIGDISKAGYHHLVWETIDNSVDEALQNRCDEIIVTIFKDGSISVKDNGAGIPVDFHKKAGISALEVILTKLHAGGKFNNDSYKVSGGLHGVGISVVNALSEWLEVEVNRNGKKFRQTYERGKKTSEVIEIGESDYTGTTIRFKPDPQIFEYSEFDFNIIKNRVAELSYLMGSHHLKFKLYDKRTDLSETFLHPNGLEELVLDKVAGLELINPKPILINKTKLIQDKNYSVECALIYSTGFNESISTFVNNINTIEGGTHLIGLKSGLSRAFNGFAKKNNLLKDKGPSGEDLREGLTLVLSLKIPDPKFESQTKIRLGNRSVEPLVSSIIFEGIKNWLEENPKIGSIIYNKAMDASRARAAARNARERIRRKSSMENNSLPFKLADCHKGTTPNKAELYLVEGDSAGGSAITGRAGFQAILPLRGKILNVEKAPLYKILEHKEIEAIVSAIGNGFLNEEFDVDKLRYHKIIIMTDADIDGSHIRTLLLTFFYRKMPKLVKEGFIYFACPPLYLVKAGRKQLFIHEEKDLRKLIEKVGIDNINVKINDLALSEKEVSDLNCSILEIKKYISDVFPGVNDLNQILNKLRHFYRGKIFCLLNAKGFLLEPAEFLDLGFTDSIIQTEEKELLKCLNKIKTQRSSFTFSFKGESENTDLIIEPIHLPLSIQEHIQFLNQVMVNENDDGLMNITIEKKGGKICKVNSFFELNKEIRLEGQKNIETKRFKGLGEMEPSQLWESTMDPNRRLLYQVQLADAIEADSIFNILMGSVVEPRRHFIEKHALDVIDLDV